MARMVQVSACFGCLALGLLLGCREEASGPVDVGRSHSMRTASTNVESGWTPMDRSTAAVIEEDADAVSPAAATIAPTDSGERQEVLLTSGSDSDRTRVDRPETEVTPIKTASTTPPDSLPPQPMSAPSVPDVDVAVEKTATTPELPAAEMDRATGEVPADAAESPTAVASQESKPAAPTRDNLPPSLANPPPKPRRLTTRPEEAEVVATSMSESPKPAEEPRRPLFNGKDLTGWNVVDGKDEAWSVVDGVIQCSHAAGGWLCCDAVYSDFQLTFEYRLSAGANTGVGIRFPTGGNPTRDGLEIQLIDDTAEKYSDLRPDQYTGAIYYQVPPLRRAKVEAGEWQTCLVTAAGSRVQVAINNEVVNDVRLDAPDEEGRPRTLASRPPLGHIGLQSHGRLVEFRNLMVRDLTREVSGGLRFVDLRNGAGAEVTRQTRFITVEYRGQLVDGTLFDATDDRGEPVRLELVRTLRGWQEGLQGMRVGGRRKLIVPPAFGYGAQGVPGHIPNDAVLVFEVDLRAAE